jgi:hypothetical protein
MKFTLFALFIALVLGACSSTPRPTSFSVDLRSLNHEAGTIETYFDRYMSIGGFKKSDVTVYYYPIEDAVCLQFKVQFAICNQFWDKAGREAFVSALERYKEDYEQRKLTKGSKRTTRRTYGNTPGFFMWKKTALALQAHGSPKMELGYTIKNRAAFFTTTQQESYYEDPIARSRNQTSPVIMMYFTRAQAEELAALFDETYLKSLGRPAGMEGSDNVDTYD